MARLRLSIIVTINRTIKLRLIVTIIVTITVTIVTITVTIVTIIVMIVTIVVKIGRMKQNCHTTRNGCGGRGGQGSRRPSEEIMEMRFNYSFKN